MGKVFNITGTCKPFRHYMVSMDSRVAEIKKMIDKGCYFSINRGRQYGKTTTLYAIRQMLSSEYIIISLDFQKMSSDCFANADVFTKTLCKLILSAIKITKDERISEKAIKSLEGIANAGGTKTIADFCDAATEICGDANAPVVLLIDEVDSASNNQVFLDFLASLRLSYLERDEVPTFQSVILSGVYDIRSLRQKIRPDDQHKYNSPWNIATKFNVRMWFDAEEIAEMLGQYEEENHSGMDIGAISQELFKYTQGYPVMVSWLCKAMAEDLKGDFSLKALKEAIKMMLTDRDVAVFGSLVHHINKYERLKTMLKDIVYTGTSIKYVPFDYSVNLGLMFSYLKRDGDDCVLSNWIFEQFLFKYFVAEDSFNNSTYDAAKIIKNQFIRNDGRLDIEQVLAKFVKHYNDIYNEKDASFIEKMGRKLFMLYLKPIINGTGNYYMEVQTRDETKCDLVIDYGGEQFVVEMKIWHGEEYNHRGEKQLKDYFDYFHLNKGYLLSFSFNKNKKVGMNTILIDGKTIVEAVV